MPPTPTLILEENWAAFIRLNKTKAQHYKGFAKSYYNQTWVTELSIYEKMGIFRRYLEVGME